MLVIFLANPLSYILLALIGYMGWKVSTTSMGLARFSFGIKGSVLPSFANIIEGIGWSAINGFLGAIALSYVLNAALGWPYYGEEGSTWIMVVCALGIGVIQALFVAYGSYSLKYAERIAVVALVILTIWETVVVLRAWEWSALWNWDAGANDMSFGYAFDLMAAFSISWVPYIADYTRYARSKNASTWAPMIGANVTLFWFALVGLMGVTAVAIETGTIDPNMSDPSSIAASLGIGWVAFLVIILTTVTTSAINIYSAAVATANVWKRGKIVPLSIAAAVIAMGLSLVPIAVGSFYDTFTSFLTYLGAVFAPMLAIFVVDYFVIRRRTYLQSKIADRSGPYWYAGGFNWFTIATWGTGVAFYFVAQRIPLLQDSVGAVVSTIVFTLLLYFIVARTVAARSLRAQDAFVDEVEPEITQA